MKKRIHALKILRFIFASLCIFVLVTAGLLYTLQNQRTARTQNIVAQHFKAREHAHTLMFKLKNLAVRLLDSPGDVVYAPESSRKFIRLKDKLELTKFLQNDFIFARRLSSDGSYRIPQNSQATAPMLPEDFLLTSIPKSIDDVILWSQQVKSGSEQALFMAVGSQERLVVARIGAEALDVAANESEYYLITWTPDPHQLLSSKERRAGPRIFASNNPVLFSQSQLLSNEVIATLKGPSGTFRSNAFKLQSLVSVVPVPDTNLTFTFVVPEVSLGGGIFDALGDWLILACLLLVLQAGLVSSSIWLEKEKAKLSTLAIKEELTQQRSISDNYEENFNRAIARQSLIAGLPLSSGYASVELIRASETKFEISQTETFVLQVHPNWQSRTGYLHFESTKQVLVVFMTADPITTKGLSAYIELLATLYNKSFQSDEFANDSKIASGMFDASGKLLRQVQELLQSIDEKERRKISLLAFSLLAYDGSILWQQGDSKLISIETEHWKYAVLEGPGTVSPEFINNFNPDHPMCILRTGIFQSSNKVSIEQGSQTPSSSQEELEAVDAASQLLRESLQKGNLNAKAPLETEDPSGMAEEMMKKIRVTALVLVAALLSPFMHPKANANQAVTNEKTEASQAKVSQTKQNVKTVKVKNLEGYLQFATAGASKKNSVMLGESIPLHSIVYLDEKPFQLADLPHFLNAYLKNQIKKPELTLESQEYGTRVIAESGVYELDENFWRSSKFMQRTSISDDIPMAEHIKIKQEQNGLQRLAAYFMPRPELPDYPQLKNTEGRIGQKNIVVTYPPQVELRDAAVLPTTVSLEWLVRPEQKEPHRVFLWSEEMLSGSPALYAKGGQAELTFSRPGRYFWQVEDASGEFSSKPRTIVIADNLSEQSAKKVAKETKDKNTETTKKSKSIEPLAKTISIDFPTKNSTILFCPSQMGSLAQRQTSGTKLPIRFFHNQREILSYRINTKPKISFENAELQAPPEFGVMHGEIPLSGQGSFDLTISGHHNSNTAEGKIAAISNTIRIQYRSSCLTPANLNYLNQLLVAMARTKLPDVGSIVYLDGSG